MGTRAVIAEPFGDGWRGRYHHWDGYPSGLGRTLWQLQRDATLGDAAAMRRYLITDERVGWSTINGADWSLPKGWRDGYGDEPHGPQSYSARGETEEQWIDSQGDDGGTEWAYVIGNATLMIWERIYEPRQYWAPVAVLAWSDPEPDWEALDQGVAP
jgi:hypothetical protein